MQKLFESFDHHPGKDGWGILQSKWHHYILIGTLFYFKGGLVAIFLGNLDLIVS
jgi:hypothetical protein